MTDFFVPIQTRIKQYGLDFETFCEWVKRYGDYDWQFDPTRKDNRTSEWEGESGLFRKFFSGNDDDARTVNMTDFSTVCDALALEEWRSVAHDPKQLFPDLTDPLDLRFGMRAHQIAAIGERLVDLLGVGVNVEVPVLHKAFIKEPLQVGRIHVKSGNISVIICNKSGDDAAAALHQKILEHSRRFSLDWDSETEVSGPCELTPLMSGEIGWLAIKAGWTESISRSRVREILRMR